MRHRNFFFAALALSSAALAVGFALATSSCSEPAELFTPSRNRITLMTWNAQTFFDAVESGGEFEDFLDEKNGWNEERYVARLERLRAVIELCGKRAGEEPEAGPDVAVLEEIENAGVVRDICGRLSRRTAYRYAAFVPPSAGSAFGTAVLSRFPVTGVTAHTVDAAASGGDETLALRPMLEVSLRVGEETLTVFAVHWKSKIGENGAADDSSPSALARRAQERLLADRIEWLGGNGSIWVACGDFNQNRGEFGPMAEYGDCWDGWLERVGSGESPGPAGSYFYDGRWETIDHFFVPKATLSGEGARPFWAVADFRVVAESPIADEDLVPNRYSVFSGTGVSDHLPLVLALEKRN